LDFGLGLPAEIVVIMYGCFENCWTCRCAQSRNETMARRNLRIIIAGIAATCLLTVPAVGWGEPDRAAGVRSAADELHQWLGDNEAARSWQRYLHWDQLQSELAKGEAADRQVIRDVLARYQSDAKGLEMRRFVAVRQALATWLETLSPPGRDELPAAVRAAQSGFQAPSDAMLAERRANVLSRATVLESFLARGGRATVQQKFLQWDVFEQQLAQPTPDLQKLNAVLQQLYSNTPGLERPQFRDLRSALHDFMNMALVHATPSMAEQYKQTLDALATELEAYLQAPTAERSHVIGRHVGWLNSAGQAPHLVTAIRKHLAQPNLHVQISNRFVQAGVNGPIDETTPLSDNILGTSLVGTARMQGLIELQLVPCDSKAVFDILLNGTANSQNVGTNRGVRVYTVGATSVAAKKRVEIDDRGIHAVPAQAACATRSTITGVEHCLRLVRQIAWNSAQRQKARAESIANARAEGRVALQMDERTDEMLAESRQAFMERFRNPLLRRGEFPEQLRLATTQDQIRVTMMQANLFQLAAPSALPDMTGDHDLAVRVHESFVGNFSEAAIGGMTLTDERLVEMLEENNREVPEELRIDPSKDPWSITFAANHPVRVEFADQKVKVVIRGRRFTRGEQAVVAEMDIWAVYNLNRTPEGATLAREGDVQAEYTKGGFENAAKIAVKTMMRKKFDALFKTEIGEAGPLKLAFLDASQGWMSLGWAFPANAAAATAAIDATAAADRQALAEIRPATDNDSR
jgi:hypothetical protein